MAFLNWPHSDSSVDSPGRAVPGPERDLVARLQHHINNPLMGILGEAQLLAGSELAEQHPELRAASERIAELALRIAGVLRTLRGGEQAE